MSLQLNVFTIKRLAVKRLAVKRLAVKRLAVKRLAVEGLAVKRLVIKCLYNQTSCSRSSCNQMSLQSNVLQSIVFTIKHLVAVKTSTYVKNFLLKLFYPILSLNNRIRNRFKSVSPFFKVLKSIKTRARR